MARHHTSLQSITNSEGIDAARQVRDTLKSHKELTAKQILGKIKGFSLKTVQRKLSEGILEGKINVVPNSNPPRYFLTAAREAKPIQKKTSQTEEWESMGNLDTKAWNKIFDEDHEKLMQIMERTAKIEAIRTGKVEAIPIVSREAVNRAIHLVFGTDLNNQGVLYLNKNQFAEEAFISMVAAECSIDPLNSQFRKIYFEEAKTFREQQIHFARKHYRGGMLPKDKVHIGNLMREDMTQLMEKLPELPHKTGKVQGVEIPEMTDETIKEFWKWKAANKLKKGRF